jgi:DNA/RNA non-specific endonuclease
MPPRVGKSHTRKRYLNFPAIFLFRQDATFYYLNVAPQWKKFNSGNWLAVELQTRWLAQKLKKDLDVYTGTHKVRTLPYFKGSGCQYPYNE